ncbi:MAG: cell division protein FtsL [Myxococcales bacterium]|nr:cell division protein FtsL [Myxococcales bacterium]
MTQRGPVVLLFIAFGSVVAAGLSHVALRVSAVQHAYALADEERLRTELEDQHRKLRLEHSLLRSPERIERLARDKLGLRHPEPGELRVIRPGVVELASASGPDAPASR